MSNRSELLRQTLLLASGSGIVIALLVAGGLWLSGAFSPVLFARWIVIVGAVIAIVEVMILQRVLCTTTVRGFGATWRRADRMQGCSAALLVGMIVLGLFVCGGLLDWWLEFH
ncbi:MAG: hypothetical protein HY741_02425 [Chloroflexi bacterium]|nr:hypothetical protein [Chloroflexota bacterium]